jgi:hypothetical protein
MNRWEDEYQGPSGLAPLDQVAENWAKEQQRARVDYEAAIQRINRRQRLMTWIAIGSMLIFILSAAPLIYRWLKGLL